MNQSLGGYSPPSFTLPPHADYKTFVNAVQTYLVNQFGQYQVQFFQEVLNVLNTGTQGFGADIAAAATIAPTTWGTRITGTGTIKTITPGNGFQSFLVFLSLNGFSFGAGGNISNPVAVIAGHPALCIFDPIGTKWWVLTA